jgi:hypothetical protein
VAIGVKSLILTVCSAAKNGNGFLGPGESIATSPVSRANRPEREPNATFGARKALNFRERLASREFLRFRTYGWWRNQ